MDWVALGIRAMGRRCALIVTKPEIAVEKGVSGFYEARVTLQGGQRMGGVPVELTVTGPNDAATVYTTTEVATRLPLRESVSMRRYWPIGPAPPGSGRTVQLVKSASRPSRSSPSAVAGV